ncbi:MAG TPA: class D sortase, partial [Steroidobacteraceae bacterium]|nr:class D sortase [Steroidobacteraceae bacterium]
MRRIELLCWLLAVVLVAPYAASIGARAVFSTVASIPVAQPQTGVAAASRSEPGPLGDESAAGAVAEVPTSRLDEGSLPQTEWSPQRRSAFAQFVSFAMPQAAATLAVPRLAATVPVFAGVNEFSMTVGAGHLSDTAPLDGDGNIAITAHRDGSFRMLKDIRVGDVLLLGVGGQQRRFVVKRHFVVQPDNISVVAPTSVSTLTLITCYPFWFVGKAPQRFIVQAELDTPGAAD